jgi:coproporphyrinogen III oxidase-like Fe-S oxidoreductase
VLRASGRGHNLTDVFAAIDAINAAGPATWSLDLISGLPEVTLAGWKRSLDHAVRSQAPHLSIYDLQVNSLFL